MYIVAAKTALGTMNRDLVLTQTAQLLHEGKPEEAISTIREYLNKYDGDSTAHMLAGQAFEQSEQYAVAAKEYRHSLAVNGNQPEVGKSLLNCLMKLRRWQEARELADELYRADPSDRVLNVMRESCHENAPLPAVGWEVDVAND